MENNLTSNKTDAQQSSTEMDTEDIIKKPPQRKNSDDNIIGRCFEILEKEEDDKVFDKTDQGLIVHYYIEKLADDTIALEMVGKSGDPSGRIIDQVSMEDFSKRFTTCSHHVCTLQLKTVDEIAKKMSLNRTKIGEKHLQKGEMEKAEDLFERALNFDNTNVEASLGLGMSKMEQEKDDEAMEVFKKMSEDLSMYEENNKHLFNEFGIYLRKKGFFPLAIKSYEQAISMYENDEVLYFNLSRAYGEKGLKESVKGSGLKDIQKAIGILKEALVVKEGFEEAKNYLKVLSKKESVMLNQLLE